MPTRPSPSSDLPQLRRLVAVIRRTRPPQIQKHALDLFRLRELHGPTARRILLELLDHSDPAVQEPAAYQLAWLHDHQAVDPLVDVLQDRQRDPRVRGQAAEAVGVILRHGDRRTTVMRRATAVLIAVLGDADTTVRFWICYALGAMRARSALAVLRRIARHDRVMCAGWWYVNDEAADAVTLIEGGRPPDRQRVDGVHPLTTVSR